MAYKPEPETVVPDKPKSETEVIRGFEFTFPDGIVVDRQLFESMAILSLDYVSKLGGRIVIAFPDSTPENARNYGDRLLKSMTEQLSRATTCTSCTSCTCFSMFCPRQQSNNSMSMAAEPAAIEMNVVGVTITDVSFVDKIRRRIPNAEIMLVKLITSSGTEALTVTRAGDPVTFQNYEVVHNDESIRFFRVQKGNDIIWISLKVLLPVVIRQNTLYAEYPNGSLPTDINLAWAVDSNDDYNPPTSVKFKEDGTVGRPLVIHQSNDVSKMINKEDSTSSHAIIGNTRTEFLVDVIRTYVV